MLHVLDAGAVARWCTAGRDALAATRQEIDDLNVYPVADGDTGTNLLLTMQAVVEALAADGPPRDLRMTVQAMARGALAGAHGNSGVILSQVLRGVAEVFGLTGQADGQDLQRALVRAAQLSYEAVAAPVEGTVLTVAREAAAAAVEVGAADLAAVVRAARAGAAAALLTTPQLLPALGAAGVVDAGGRGLCVLLEALEAVVTGVADRPAGPPPQALLVDRDRSGLAPAREQGSAEFGYEVQYLLRDAPDASVEQLRRVLGDLGDSLVVVGGEGLHNVHVHVNDVGAALEAGLDAGRPFRVTVTRFADQVADTARRRTAETRARAVVAVVPGEGLARLFRAGGAAVVAADPTVADLLEAVLATAADEVVVLPDDLGMHGVAGAAAAAARESGLQVAVVPTRSVLQGLAALAVADGQRSFADDVGAMAAAAGATRWAEVTTAERASVTMAGMCRPGDVLGLLEGDVVLIGDDVERVAAELVDRMLAGGGELLTVVSGADAADGAARRLVDGAGRRHPAIEVLSYDGGQPRSPLLLGVE